MSDYQDFSHFGLDPRILEAIAEIGFVKPTPIQSKAIPIVLEGKDVMGAAQTGTGKTAGFGLPLLQKILPTANTSVSPARHPVRALVLSPTRELADQTAQALTSYASHTPLRVGVVYGGVDIAPQEQVLRNGVEVLIATPGRLLDHLQQRTTNLSQVQIVILDEADRMMDMGFLPDITRILQKLPQNRQNLMFSATFSEPIKKLAKSFLNKPVLIEVARQNATAATIEQQVYLVPEDEKTDALIELLNSREEIDGLPSQCIVFVNAKVTSRRLTRQLEQAGFNADSIHGDRTQEERTRILSDFKSGKLNILVATDVAARGLDIAELPLVINFDVPFAAEDYVHRIGRTGRAGLKGSAITLMTGADEKNVKDIERLTKQKFRIEQMEVRHYDPRRSGAGKVYTYKAPQQYVDPFFNKPYEPSRSNRADQKPEPQSAKSTALVGKKHNGQPHTVSVLLGGVGRKN